MVKTIIKTEDDTFMLESYEDLKNELNKRLNIVTKKYGEKKVVEANRENEIQKKQKEEYIGAIKENI